MTTMQDADTLARIRSVPHWYHRFEFAPGVTTPGINDTGKVLESLGLPEDCRGLRALDLGTRDGFFAFELRRRGAEVTAVDYMPIESTGFAVAREILGSDVEYTQENLYNLRPETHGTFDIVLFLGLLYHLPDPMAALRILRSLCRGTMHLETQALDNAVLLADGTFTTLDSFSPRLRDVPLMQFYPGTALNNDPTNYWAPNFACLKRMLEENRFAVVDSQLSGPRAIFKCRVTEDDARQYFNDIASGRQKPL
jgi:tRNA (mo5U34)-methyltransferase